MATNTVAIRDYLKQKGYRDRDIGWNKNDKALYLKGQEFYRPTDIRDGQSYATSQALDAALSKFQPKKPVQVTPIQSTRPAQQTTPQPQQINYGNAINSLAQQLLSRIQQPEKPEPFQYTPETDPAYQAALRTATANAGSAQNNALAKLRSMGQGRSSYSETLAQQIGQRELGKVTDQALPQLLSQAYQRYRDQIGDQRNAYNDLLSGIGTIADLNQQQINNERNAWQDRFNYGKEIGQFANGQKTLAAQNAEAERAYRDTRDAIMDERYKIEFDQDVERYGLEQAAKKAYENRQLSISAMNAATSRMNAETSQANTALSQADREYNQLVSMWERTGRAPNGLQDYGVKPGDPWPEEAEEEKISVSDVKKDINGSRFVGKGEHNEQIVTDVPGLEAYILSFNLSDEDSAQLYRYYGLPIPK